MFGHGRQHRYRPARSPLCRYTRSCTLFPWESCRGITLSAEFGGSRSAIVFPAFRPKPDMVGFNHRVLSPVPVRAADESGYGDLSIGPIVPSESTLGHPVSLPERTRQTRQNRHHTRTFRAYLRKRWCLMPSGDISRNLS